MNSRLDGSTKPEARIQIMERFNRDPRIFCMILSTRSGGVGVNLTGADTVIFYDSDWNPTIDAQAQDRAHRIGQTRDVHIYRFIAKNTIEENILKKADQKRHLGHLAIEEGNFNIDGLKEEQLRTIVEGKHAHLLASVEDKADQDAAKDLIDEVGEDEEEFVESDESDTEGLRTFLSPIENYAVSFYSKELAQRRLDEKNALESRDRFLQEQREKLERLKSKPEQQPHQNHHNHNAQKRPSLRSETSSPKTTKRSRRLLDKEIIDNDDDSNTANRTLRSSRNCSKHINDTAESSDEYSPEPLAQFPEVHITHNTTGEFIVIKDDNAITFEADW